MLSRRGSALLVLASLCLLMLAASTAPTRVSAIGKKLTEKQLAEIEDQWMEDEEETDDDTPFKYTKTADGARMPPTPGGPKTEMGFVTIKGAKDRKKTDQLAGRWGDQMMTAGIDVRAYTIEDNRILFVCDQRGFKDMSRVRSFVLDQKETEEFEWNSKKSKPGDKLASGDAAGGDAAADPLARFQAMQDEQAALAKRKERQAKKKAQEKKRKQRAEKERAEKKKKKEAAEKKKKEQEAKEAAAKKQQDAAPLKTEL